MFGGESILSFVFRLLNFAVLVGFFCYLFRRYGWSLLKARIAAKEAALLELEQRKETIRAQQKGLERHMHEQQQLGALLEQKIERWHDATVQEAVHKKREQHEYELLQEKRMEKKSYNRTIECAQHEVMPRAINKAKAYFEQQYTQAEKNGFIQQLLTFMEHGNP
jgi:F0F1-type ATP synthase membrane subunit b/b'